MTQINSNVHSTNSSVHSTHEIEDQVKNSIQSNTAGSIHSNHSTTLHSSQTSLSSKLENRSSTLSGNHPKTQPLPETEKQSSSESGNQSGSQTSLSVHEYNIPVEYTPQLRDPKTVPTLPPQRIIPDPSQPLEFGDRMKLSIPNWGGSVLVVNNRPFLKINRAGKGGSSLVYKVSFFSFIWLLFFSFLFIY